jgi:hypothetical protein
MVWIWYLNLDAEWAVKVDKRTRTRVLDILAVRDQAEKEDMCSKMNWKETIGQMGEWGIGI